VWIASSLRFAPCVLTFPSVLTFPTVRICPTGLTFPIVRMFLSGPKGHTGRTAFSFPSALGRPSVQTCRGGLEPDRCLRAGTDDCLAKAGRDEDLPSSPGVCREAKPERFLADPG
jgi:hypothetical protein